MFEDRQYQIDAVDWLMQSEGRPILCSPCGSGKSYICAMIAKRTIEEGGRFGILTPREELLYQMAETMQNVCGLRNVGILKAGEEWRRSAPVQVISWPTLLSRTAKSEAWFPDVDRLAIDECHLSVSPKMAERVLPYYKDRAKVFGVTATPARKSGKGLGHFFTEIKNVTWVRDLIAEGKLAPLEYWGGKLADLEGVRTTAGDYNSKDLSKASTPLVGDVIDNWLRLASECHTIVFAVDVAHCEALTERFQQAGISAASLHVHKTPERRHEIVRQFKARKIQVLVNVTITSYGFDAPSVDCIVLARPTKSIVLHIQMLGRAMRPFAGKEAGMVLDHADNVRRLGQVEDVFRWRLDTGKDASANWTRDERNKDYQPGDEKTYTCEKCGYIFSRSRVCKKCGTEIPMPKRDIAATDDELVRLSADRANVTPEQRKEVRLYYAMAKGWCELNGRKIGAAWHQTKRKYKFDAPWSWRDLPSVPPDARVQADMHKASVDYARRQAYAKRKKKKAAA